MSSEAVDRFNALPQDEAERRLYGCLANRKWAARVAAARPYRDVAHVLAVADLTMFDLTPSDWLAAFAAHPRIGERGGHSPVSSEQEQSRVGQAPPETVAELAAENRRYEARFGHGFIIAAAGRGADDILEAMRRRMENDSATELDVAADEQRKITRMRVERLLSD